MALRFRFADLHEEVDALQALAKDFIDPSSEHVLRQLQESLRGIWASTQCAHEWKIRRNDPLRTRISHGEYEPGPPGHGRRIRAELTSNWILTPQGTFQPKAPSKRECEIGLASTVIRWMESNAQGNFEDIAMWRMELGADDSPGLYFHCQVLGEKAEAPFPDYVPVPRLPSLPLTPMAALDFALGELFQTRWSEEVLQTSPTANRWSNIQLPRFKTHCAWQTSILQSKGGSPLMLLKRAKPLSNFFTAHLGG